MDICKSDIWSSVLLTHELWSVCYRVGPVLCAFVSLWPHPWQKQLWGKTFDSVLRNTRSLVGLQANSPAQEHLQCSALAGVQEAKSTRRHQENPPPQPYPGLSNERHQCPVFQYTSLWGWFIAKPNQQTNMILMLATGNTFSQNVGGNCTCTVECCLASTRGNGGSGTYIYMENSQPHTIKWPNSRIWCCVHVCL